MIKKPDRRMAVSMPTILGVRANQYPILLSYGLEIVYKKSTPFIFRKTNNADYYGHLRIYVSFVEARMKGYDFWGIAKLKYKYNYD